jgi:hypothetical protein
LGGNHFSTDVLAALLPGLAGHRLTHLEMHSNPIGADGGRLLADCPHLAGLHTLQLDSTHLGDDGLAALSRSPHLAGLRWLRLSYNGITDAAAAALLDAPFADRCTIDLNGNGLSPTARERLRKRFGLRVFLGG